MFILKKIFLSFKSALLRYIGLNLILSSILILYFIDKNYRKEDVKKLARNIFYFYFNDFLENEEEVSNYV